MRFLVPPKLDFGKEKVTLYLTPYEVSHPKRHSLNHSLLNAKKQKAYYLQDISKITGTEIKQFINPGGDGN